MNIRLWWLPVFLLIAACGGDDSSRPRTPAPPSGLSYQPQPAFVVSQPIATFSPTVTGTVSSYTVSPPLPPGLSLNATTGAISGTPTAVSPATAYIVSATNAGGAATATISLTVNDLAPNITYGSATYNLTTGVPQAISASVTGGAVLSWSISPALPAGLVFSTSDGGIGGTPQVESNVRTYVVTAQNSGGSDTFEFTLSVASSADPGVSGVLLDLGHVNVVGRIRYDGNRVLSIDGSNTWILWNSQTKAKLAQGSVPCDPAITCSDSVQLAGPTFVTQTSAGLEVRASSDGHLLALITAPAAWWKIATDGSYVVIGHEASISAWSTAGTQLFSRPGYYAQAKVFPAPTQVRIGAGAAGANVVELIEVSSGTASTLPIQGAFHSWFLDGGRFITNLNTTYWIYSAAGTQQDFGVVPSTDQLGGQGNYFWLVRNYRSLDIYEVGSGGATPAATHTTAGDLYVSVSRQTLGILEDDQVTIFDLSGSTPSAVTHTSSIDRLRAYASLSSTDWLVGNIEGVVADITGTPEFFSLGAARDIVANGERIAVARAAGIIQLFDAETLASAEVLNFDALQLALSADGTVLAALDYSYSNARVAVLNVATGAVIRSWVDTTTPPARVTLSESGDVVGIVFGTVLGSNMRRVFDVSTGTEIWSGPASPGSRNALEIVPRLNPSGTVIAASDIARAANSATSLYHNGVLRTAVAGWAVGWLDENRLLLNRYVELNAGRVVEYTGSVIVDANGAQVQVPILPELLNVQSVGPDTVYSPGLNTIFSLSSGASVWSSVNRTTRIGGVTATHVVFGSGTTVRIEPF